MTVEAQPRQPAGAPVGGQFATTPRGEGTLELGGADMLGATPIVEEHDETMWRGPVFENRYATVEMVPSRYGPFTTVRSGNGGGAAVLAVRDGHVMLVCQPRYAVGQHMWELPRGGNRPGESNFDAGAREAAEETGVHIDPEHLVDLGAIVPDSGVVSTTAGLLIARLPSPPAVPDTEPAAVTDEEVDTVRWVPVDDVVAACVDGTITDAFTCVAVMRARLLGLI